MTSFKPWFACVTTSRNFIGNMLVLSVSKCDYKKPAYYTPLPCSMGDSPSSLSNVTAQDADLLLSILLSDL